jgi:hypothetical protein
MWTGFLCKRDFFPFAKEKNGAVWLERNEDFPLKERKFPLTWHGPHNVCKTVWLSEALLVIRLLKYAVKKWITIRQILVKTAIFDVKNIYEYIEGSP